MSIQFDKPISEEQQSFIKELMGDRLEVVDDHTALINSKEILQTEMKAIANKTNQVTTVELNDEGEIKIMSDGTRYQVTEAGWKKLRD